MGAERGRVTTRDDYPKPPANVIPLLFLSVLSCSPAETGGRDDRDALLAAARTDSQTLAVVREVEALASHEDRARAVVRIREAAIPAADRALSTAEGLSLRTGAGRAAQDELLSVLHLRREAIDDTLAAVQARDDIRFLDALDKEREVEEAMIAWEQNAMRVGRAGSGGGCGR